MSRPRALITGLGPISALGMGLEPTWQALLAGQSGITKLDRFDPGGFPAQIAGQAPNDFKITKLVPRSHRKAAKVMARDIELAVVAADLAARDAKLVTKGTRDSDDQPLSGPSNRMGCHIGAGLIAADIDELSAALVQATDANGEFDMHRWGNEGMTHLTPLWLLKYLPNMLACHVTIIHDLQGPSNTITCAEASAALSIGESLRVVRRGAADLCFCGGADSKLNPMAYLRQHKSRLLNTTHNDDPSHAVQTYQADAPGSAVGEGGGIVILETFEHAQQRRADDPSTPIYAEVAGFGASQSVNRDRRNMRPNEDGSCIVLAIRAALRDAAVAPEAIDLIVPFGLGHPEFDRADVAALKTVFGEHLASTLIAPVKPYVGNCCAGASALDVIVAAKALAEQTLPAVINCDQPVAGLPIRTAPARQADMQYALCVTTSTGGQNAALVLKRYTD